MTPPGARCRARHRNAPAARGQTIADRGGGRSGSRGQTIAVRGGKSLPGRRNAPLTIDINPALA